MHNENEYKYAFSKYRLEKAQESLKYAKILMDNDGYAETVNRAYYAIFHATRAILAIDGVDRKRHSGVISYFQENYVKTGIFDKECSYMQRGAFCHYGMMRRMLWYYLLFIKRQNHLSNKFTFILVLRRAFNINMTAFS